jgi:hypothetical protein
VFGEYDTLDFEKVENWVEKVKKEAKGKEIEIDVDVVETSEGFCEGPDEIRLEPYYEREENDKEYKRRVEDEERQYKEIQERKRLRREEYRQYQKDMEEMERIKKKYYL